jgi:PAS domain S-box-containing protein
MNLKQLKYLESDDLEGKFYVAGTRSLLIPVSVVASIYNTLRKIIGNSADMLIYRIGENIGSEYVNVLAGTLKDASVELDEDALLEQVYITISVNSGWGIIDIKKMDLEKDAVEIELANSPSQELVSGSNYFLERGILAGVYQQITGRRIYYNINSEAKAKKTIMLQSIREIPPELMGEEKFTLLSEIKLEEMIKEKIADLEIAKDSSESILQNIPDMLIIIDEDKNVISINSYAEQLLGYKISEIKGLTLSQLPILSSKMHEKIEAAYNEAFKTGIIRDLELDVVNKGGDIFTISFTISMLKYPKEEVSGAILIGRDIRQMKAHIVNLQESHQELDSKVKELEEFHDLAIGRELKMVELKEEIAKLKEEIKRLKSRIF